MEKELSFKLPTVIEIEKDVLLLEEINQAEYLINTRPHKRFNGLTPAEVFYKEMGTALFS